ncbi:hypothetical protein U1Q18_026715, partial [Sarracenia purpurea var. burkii]
ASSTSGFNGVFYLWFQRWRWRRDAVTYTEHVQRKTVVVYICIYTVEEAMMTVGGRRRSSSFASIQSKRR